MSCDLSSEETAEQRGRLAIYREHKVLLPPSVATMPSKKTLMLIALVSIAVCIIAFI